MRNGALITGKNICSSSPVETRGFQLLALNTCRYWAGVGLRTLPPTQLNPASSCGQPNGVLITWLYCAFAICNCERRMIGSIPVSTNGTIATGPAIV